MAHIIKDEIKLRLSIFVILFLEEKAFFVWKTPEANLKNTYKHHYYLNNSKTKELFKAEKEKGLHPPMFLLETVDATHEEAFLHCIAWSKYFEDHGYSSLGGEFIDKYVRRLGEESKALYEKIKDNSFNVVCPKDEELFPEFGKKKVKRDDPTRRLVSFWLTPEEYDEVKSEATQYGKTMSEFCRNKVRDGRVIVVAPEVFSTLTKHIDKFVSRDKELKNMILTIYSTKTYFPADLEFLQMAVEENARQQKEAMQDVKDILQELLD